VNQTNKWWASNYVAYFIALSSLALIIFLFIGSITISHVDFALTLNGFSFFSFFSAFIDIATVYLILIKKRYSQTTNWFLLFLAGAMILAIAEGLQRSSVYPAAALFWQNVSFIGYALLPPILYLFIVSYASQYRRQFVALSSILLTTWGVVAFLAGTGLFYKSGSGHLLQAPWGYYTNDSKIEFAIVLWSTGFYLFGTGLLLQLRKTTHNILIKKQIRIFILAFLAPYFAAILTLIILPPIIPNVIPPLATFVGAFSAIYVYYGMRQYRLFDLDPQVLAQNILNTMSEAVIITRPDLTIESVNPEAERLLATSAQKASDTNLKNYFSDNNWQLISQKLAGLQHETKFQPINKSEVRASDGKVIPVRIAATMLVDGGEVMANVLVFSDISEITTSFDALQHSATQIYQQNEQLQKLEGQLREEKANVEHIVEVRTKELVDAQNKLKAADQLKTEFIMLTSHNLRTPLAIAEGYADMLSSQKAKPEDTAALIGGLKSGLQRLGSFVEELLTISSLESGDQFALEDVSFQQILDPLIKEVTDLARTQNDKVIVNLRAGDIKLKANATRLQGALRNVLDNACKFTKDGTVEIDTSRSENRLIINVSDTGIGINAEEIPNLFTKFHRATNALNGGYEGEGIGLYLTQLILTEHHGKISCVSQIDKGSTFTIELPCA
jgi:PAS domain S-box-containing protein